MVEGQSQIGNLLVQYERELVQEWLAELQSSGAASDTRIKEGDLRKQATEFIGLLRQAALSGSLNSIEQKSWEPVKDFLEGLSRDRAIQGFQADQTASFIFSFKKPLFSRLRLELKSAPQSLAEETWIASDLLDRLGMYTFKAFQKTMEDVIRRQQEELLELSTPVVKVWDGILALPMIGTLDSARTQIVMESLLQRIVDTGSEIAIIDITGVPTVDTLVAQHLLKTVTAIRLMGADCIISGIRPQIAQTIVHLGVDLDGVTTKSNLSDALLLALKRTGFTISRAK